MQYVSRLYAQGLLHLGDDFAGPGDGHVNLVEHRHNGQLVLHGQKRVGDRLRLNALGRIDQKNGAFAGRKAARDLIVKIDVTRGVNEVQLIPLAGMFVIDGDWVHLDGDAALSLEIHIIENLGTEIARRDGSGLEQKLVGEGALAMVDVRDDGKVS